MTDVRIPFAEVAVLLACAFVAVVTPLPAGAAGCPNPVVSPKTFPEGIKVRPYSLTNFSTLPETQQVCIFLENVSGAVVPVVSVDSQVEEPGTGVPGPWALVSSSSINISGGVSVTCSNSGNVGTTAAAFTSLNAGDITDICCFTYEEDPMGSGCSKFPDAGDLARHTFVSGSVVTMPYLSGDPVGGTTCGLVSLEVLIVLPLLRLARRRMRR